MKKNLLPLVFLSSLFVLINTSFSQVFPPFSCDSTTYTPITGTAGPSGDDETTPVTLPFTFTYLAVPYTQVSICSNGFITMGNSTVSTYTNDLCSLEPNKVCPFWDDLYPPGGGTIQYTTLGSQPDRVFVVQYTNVSFYPGTTCCVTVQARFYETSNLIQFIYGPANSYAGGTGSIGLIDAIGGTTHFLSVTPGPTCAATTTSQVVCNNNVPFNTPSLAPGVRYSFGSPSGIGGTNEVPHEYKLEQNYPNPFNPETVINFEIPKSGHTTLSVYNSLGQLVADLVNRDMTSGKYNVKFDASKLPSGTYIYRFESGSFIESKKMTVIK